MAEENQAQQARAEPTPQRVNPAGEQRLAQMEKEVPADDASIFSAFDDQSTTIPGVIGGLMGLQNKGDPFAIFERTIVDPEELQILRGMKMLAEHGFGGEVLDRPIPFVAQQLVDYLRLKISIADRDGHGTSRAEAVAALTNWTKVIEAREAQAKQQNKGIAG